MCNLLPESVAFVVVLVVVAINIDQTPQNFIVRRFTTLLNRIFMAGGRLLSCLAHSIDKCISLVYLFSHWPANSISNSG